jgi:hypothetical protein
VGLRARRAGDHVPEQTWSPELDAPRGDLTCT